MKIFALEKVRVLHRFSASYMIVGDSSYLSTTACWGEPGTSEEKSIK